MLGRKQVIVATKCDVLNENLYTELENLAKEKKIEIFKISSSTGEGVKELLNYVTKVLKTLPKEELIESQARKIYTLEDTEEEKFFITHDKDVFYITGKAVEKLIRKVNIDDNESMYYLHKGLENLGVEEALKKEGIKEGDTVKILDYEFEWYE